MHSTILTAGDVEHCKQLGRAKAAAIAKQKNHGKGQILSNKIAFTLGYLGEMGFGRYMGLDWQPTPPEQPDNGYDFVTRHGTKIDVKTSDIWNPLSSHRKNLLLHHNAKGTRADVYVLAWYYPKKRWVEFPGFALVRDFETRGYIRTKNMKHPCPCIDWQRLRKITTVLGKPAMFVDWKELPQCRS